MSTFPSLVRSGAFVVTAEINPPKSADGDVVTRRASALRGCVDAANVTDSNRAVAAMSSIPAALLVRDAGVTPIVQMTGRDRNRIALQGDLLGAAALGLDTFLCMSGDDPRVGNHPDAVHVKDLDGIGLLKMASGMRDRGVFLSGDAITKPPQLFLGGTASPFGEPTSRDVDRTIEKLEAGADFLQTQPVFDIVTFSAWLSEVRKRAKDPAILAGVLVLRSADQAKRLAKVPGVTIPDATVERMRGARDAEQEGIAIAVELVQELRALPGVHGVHIYAIEWPEAVGLVVQRSGLREKS